MTTTVTPEQYGETLVRLLRFSPELIRACSRWEDLDRFVDANSYLLIADDALSVVMPDSVAECEDWYYPLLRAGIDIAEATLWPKKEARPVRILGIMSGYVGPARAFVVEFNDERGNLVAVATRRGDETTVVVLQHLTEQQIEAMVRSLGD